MNTANKNTPSSSKDEKPKKQHPLFDSIGTASMLGLHIVSGIIVGAIMGYYLDVWLGTKPWLFIIFLIIGIGAGFRNMWYDAQKIIRNMSKTDDDV